MTPEDLASAIAVAREELLRHQQTPALIGGVPAAFSICRRCLMSWPCRIVLLAEALVALAEKKEEPRGV